jgi:aminopeptidase N
MIMLRLSFALLLISISSQAKDPYPKNANIDVKHYRFQLELNDSTDIIAGEATISIRFKKAITSFDLDLYSINANGKGMKIKSITSAGKPVAYTHQNNRINLKLNTATTANDQQSFIITYSGIPEDGLIIGRNKFNERGFFGDNWPDRGHHWLPVIDHPSDKAHVEFVIIAPEHYQVVATGKLMEESNLTKHRKLTHWKESTDVPVKVMTIGVARFSIQLSGEPDGVPVSTWVYPQNRDDGFSDFAIAPKILAFFQHYVGPFSYAKLAHVQSKTRWGGLENAGNIFYFENAVNGKNEQEGLIAHETAHQWFGDAVTENDWYHVWLSEGFATYFASLYFEYAYGHDKLVEEERIDRQQVIDYAKKNTNPIIDTITDIGKVLSINTYQKAGWVLHMLRREIGDAAFQKGIREYYATYRNGNAMTADFQRIMEANSGKNLNMFFNQWLFQPGHPKLAGTWAYDAQTQEVTLIIEQTQKTPLFKVPIDVGVQNEKGEVSITTLFLDSKSKTFRLSAPAKPASLTLDPDTWLLYEGEIRPK